MPRKTTFLEREQIKTIADQQKLSFYHQKYIYFRQKGELKSRRNNNKYRGQIKHPGCYKTLLNSAYFVRGEQARMKTLENNSIYVGRKNLEYRYYEVSGREGEVE